MSEPMVRAWCPKCGKAAGVVRRTDAGELVWESTIRFNHAATERRRTGYTGDLPEGWTPGWLNKPVRVWLDASHTSDAEDDWHATCRGGHDLVANLGILYAAALAGGRNIKLRHTDDEH